MVDFVTKVITALGEICWGIFRFAKGIRFLYHKIGLQYFLKGSTSTIFEFVGYFLNELNNILYTGNLYISYLIISKNLHVNPTKTN